MPIPTPFHSRTAPLCKSHEWRTWSGYLAASLYEINHDAEYYAIRNAVALIDVSPLFKYEIRGPDSVRLLNRVMTRDIAKCAVGQVMYTPWCNDKGKVIDDGTVAHLEQNLFRVTAADPNLVWLQDNGIGMDAEVTDVSSNLAALAVQGPNSRQVLKHLLPKSDLDALRYYRLINAKTGRINLTVTRTGFTGDLGYELWLDPKHADTVWDMLMEIGVKYGMLPAGMVALDIARIEAGLLLLDVDYISSRKAHIQDQKSSPFELGLGWTVDLTKEYFIGRDALMKEKRRGSKWQFIGIEVNWKSLEALFSEVDLPPLVAGRASRSSLPVYKHNRQIGYASSHTFSPIMKKYIALANLNYPLAKPGDSVEIEITVEHVRHRAKAVITDLPFYNPVRKRA